MPQLPGLTETKSPLLFQIPLVTEALLANPDLVTGSSLSLDKNSPGLLVDLDLRRRDWPKVLGLPKGSVVSWDDLRTVEVQDLSSLVVPLRYRVTFGDGCWRDKSGRHYFGVAEHLVGLDLKRQVSTVALRVAVLLAVLGGVGLRQVVWLLSVLFGLTLSKSALDRWVLEVADHLPDAEGMAKLLLAEAPVKEAHFDELFPRGKRKKKPVLVVRDEHGRLLVAEEVEHRDEEEVVRFLEKLKSWGFAFETFYIDHYASYALAIRRVFPHAKLQYDYFHILQSVWRTLWRAFVCHRKEVKQRSKEVKTPWYAAKLEALAKRLWEHRGLLFKFQELSGEEKATLAQLLGEDSFLRTLRRFLGRVRGIFTDSRGELGARQRLGRLLQRKEVTSEKIPAFAKAMSFLSEHFEQMITFLRAPEVKRNSLAETGMRTLRRLEQGHDGFRTPEGRDRYLRLYQAIRYLKWGVQRRDGSLGLPAPPEG